MAHTLSRQVLGAALLTGCASVAALWSAAGGPGSAIAGLGAAGLSALVALTAWRRVGSLARLESELAAAARRVDEDHTAAGTVLTRGGPGTDSLAADAALLVGRLDGLRAATVAQRDQVLETFDALDNGLVEVDPEGRVRTVNAAFRRMFPGSRARPGLPVERVLEVPGALEMLVDARSGQSRLGRREVVEEGPPRRVFELGCLGVGAGGAVLLVRDVSDARRLERLGRELVANASHDLRTPLTAVRGFSETLLEGGLEDPRTARSFVERIHRQAVRMGELVEGMLDLARIEAGDLRIEPVPLDLGPVVDEALDTVRARAAAAGVVLRVDLRPGAQPRADARAVVHILTNLLENALEHTHRGGEVAVSAQGRGDTVALTVADTGEGIEPHHLTRIFERFYRVERGRRRRAGAGGTGLGLAMVKHLALAQGGRVTAESEVSRGSVFTVELPAAVPPGGPGPDR